MVKGIHVTDRETDLTTHTTGKDLSLIQITLLVGSQEVRRVAGKVVRGVGVQRGWIGGEHVTHGGEAEVAGRIS